jgi:hypothetical protein
MNNEHDFEKLLAFIEKLPAIDLPAGRKSIGYGSFKDGNWWVKFNLDTTHPFPTNASSGLKDDFHVRLMIWSNGRLWENEAANYSLQRPVCCAARR